LEKIDPSKNLIDYRLYKTAFLELSKLGRPLETTIALHHYKNYLPKDPKNTIILKKWDGQKPDT
jgi:hypothetical protein